MKPGVSTHVRSCQGVPVAAWSPNERTHYDPHPGEQ